MTVSYLETGLIYCDDNLERLAQFPAESVDLIYLDPPFFTNRVYEVIWGDEAEVRSFEDRWEGGIQVYVNWMRERVMELHRVLKRTGSFYFHCDPTASHYLKAMTDEIFGRDRFRNEIAWKRFSAKNDPKRYGRSHDVILYYVKSDKFTWNVQYGPFEENYVEENYRYVEEGTGRRYRRGDLTAHKPGGDTDYEWHGMRPYRGRHWAYSRENMDKMLADGRIEFRKTGMPVYKRYLDEQPGVPLQDIWTDIRLHAGSKERLGYPTQKPLALMERIINASSRKGDIVLDPFCGCGTTLVAAQQLGRPWIGIDISPTAVNVVKERLERVGASSVKLVGMPVTEQQVRTLKPFEFQNWVIQAMHGTHAPRKVSDMGIDGYSFMLHEPIQVKQSSGVSRPVVDGFQTAIERTAKQKGYIVAFSFTKGAYEEAARVKAKKGLDIVLLEVTDLLNRRADLVTPDPGLLMPELPLPEPRSPEALPSVEELIASDKSQVSVGA